nr:uncharacterized protein LOC107418606 [Ipomoea trifida]GMD21155.1 uncharacterized protein LOC107418606 [Ipomoea batatas]
MSRDLRSNAEGGYGVGISVLWLALLGLSFISAVIFSCSDGKLPKEDTTRDTNYVGSAGCGGVCGGGCGG